MKNKLDWIITDISEKELNETFNDVEWETNVVDAAFYGTTNLLKLFPEKDPTALISKIINYNVTKKLNQFFASKIKPLPKKLTFDKTDLLEEIIYILDNYMSLVYILKQAQTLKPKTKLDIYTHTQSLQNNIKKWYDRIKDTYTNDGLILQYTKVDNTHCYIIIKNK